MEFETDVSLIAIIYTIVFILITAKVFKWLKEYYDRVKHYSSFTHRPILPFIGNLHQCDFGASDGFAKDIYETCTIFKDEPFFISWIATKPFLDIHRCDIIEEFVRSSQLSDKSEDYDLLHPWLKQGLLTSGGEKWASRRKLLTPAFHFDILKDFLPIFNEHSDVFIEKLKNECKKGNVALRTHIETCALDIICETAMGEHLSTQTNSESEYIKAVHNMCLIMVDRNKFPWLWPDLIFKLSKYGRLQKKSLEILHGFTKRIIQERDANFEGLASSKHNRIAFLDLLLEAKRQDPDGITTEDIQEEVDTFMFEGHDTTATSLNWSFYLIASHPEVQEKIHDELERVVGNTYRHLSVDDLNQLTYLECVIKESLRLFPSVPYIGRDVKEDVTIHGHKFLKGTSAIIIPFMIHRDERYFPDAEKFDPDRFSPKASMNRPAYAFIPFSAGRRNCIGQKFAMMEMKTILANTLKHFEVKCDQTMEEIGYGFQVVLRPMKNIMFTLKPRYNF